MAVPRPSERQQIEPLPAHLVRGLVAAALAEDVGSGDVTSEAVIGEDAKMSARIVAREPALVAGLGVAKEVFAQVDRGVSFAAQVADGDRIEAGDEVAGVTGPARATLAAERTALNFLQRMSGIATETARYVAAVVGTSAVIIDTRKTAPGLRALDKYAVRVGGGRLHRMGLFDGCLIKDNHIACAGGVKAAVAAARRRLGGRLNVQVEVTDLDEVEEALEAGADGLLLDNMDTAMLRQAVARARGRAFLEASGGISLDGVAEIAASGVDMISVGSLTHSVRAIDFALEARPQADRRGR